MSRISSQQVSKPLELLSSFKKIVALFSSNLVSFIKDVLLVLHSKMERLNSGKLRELLWTEPQVNFTLGIISNMVTLKYGLNLTGHNPTVFQCPWDFVVDLNP